MIDPKFLLEQFLRSQGRGAGAFGSGAARGGLAGGALGGLLGMVLRGGKRKGGLGGMMRSGGAAALATLAYRAWRDWEAGRAAHPAPAAAWAGTPEAGPAFEPAAAPARDGTPFELALIRAMVSAAKADGHVDAEEQRAIFARVEEAGLDAGAKALVLDALSQPADAAAIARSAGTREQAAEIYLVSRLAIDPDHPTERAYLEELARRLELPPALVEHLSAQAEAALAS